jgi:ribosome-associated protein
MAKKKAAKKAPKKAPKKKISSLAKGKSKKSVAKRSASSKGKKTTVKSKKPTEKEKNVKKANAIENSQKKKTVAKKRVKVTTSAETNSLLDSIVEGMQEKKAKNITVLDLHNIENRIADFFVICDADSGTHVDAIAGSVEEEVMKRTGEKAYHSEGQQNSEWILIDYVNIVVHVFLRETREYYNVEGLWGDAEIRTIN